VLQEGELLVALHMPPPEPTFGASFLRFIPRNEMDIAIANVAASVLLDDSKQHIVSARIAIGSVAPTPVFVKQAGDLLAGKEANEASIEEAAEAAKGAATPINDMRGTIAQRIHLVGVLTKRTLRTAISRAREG
jgi:carbon-monoxide dehydrogenase medium subunit